MNTASLQEERDKQARQAEELATARGQLETAELFKQQLQRLTDDAQRREDTIALLSRSLKDESTAKSISPPILLFSSPLLSSLVLCSTSFLPSCLALPCFLVLSCLFSCLW